MCSNGDGKNVMEMLGAKTLSFNSLTYKYDSILPMKNSSKLDFGHCNIKQINSHCDDCFPTPNEIFRDRYVDLLEFSQFNGVPYAIIDDKKKPSRWLADLRYTWSTPLPHNYPSVSKEVLSSKRVNDVVSQLEATDHKQSSIKEKVSRFYNEIRAKLSKFICKICAYALYKIFRRLMTKLLVCPKEMERLRNAEQSGIPLVYLPLHRSHLDYLLITWCAWHFGLKLPHIASGDNLNLSGLGWLLRATGAFFIRRRVNPDDVGGKDMLYRAVLHSYIEQLLKKNLPIEFFLEGTRNRFGKSLTPKNGLISNVVQAVQQGIIKDCYLVPVSYTYDAVVEGIFLNELMGIPKVRESVIGVFKGVFDAFRKTNQCGIVRIHYGRPVKLTSYLTSLTVALSCKENRPVSLTKIPHSFSYRELVPWHRQHSETMDDRALIRAIGFHVVYEAQMMCSISPVSVFSCLLLSKFRNGIDKATLADDCQWLAEMLISEGAEVLGYRFGETDGMEIVDYSLSKLSACVDVNDNDFIRPIQSHRQFVHLAYSKNSMIARFAVKAAIAIALICRCPTSSHEVGDVVEDVLSICDWLQFEFMFSRPCEELRTVIETILGEDDWCHPDNGFLVLENGEMGGGDCHSNDNIRIRDDRSYEILSFFSNLIRPFIQSLYMISIHISSNSCSETEIPEYKYIRNVCQSAMSNNISMPFTPFVESINSDSFKNSLRILRDKGFMKTNQPAMVSRCTNGHIKDVITNLERILRVQ